MHRAPTSALGLAAQAPFPRNVAGKAYTTHVQFLKFLLEKLVT
jgi:hypothetical protein